MDNSTSNNIGVEAMGIPATIITTMDTTSDDKEEVRRINEMDALMNSLNLAIDGPPAFEKSNVTRDESTAGETFSESSSRDDNHRDEDSEGEEDASDDDDDASSVHSHHTNDSARDLLKQAKERIDHQSVIEEAKVLRTLLAQYKTSSESAMHETLVAKRRCDALELQLSRASDTAQVHKRKELRWEEEKATMERDFMNQLNDMCRGMQERERELTEGIMRRDRRIVELQNEWNEREIDRKKERREEKRAGGLVAYVETEGVESIVDLDDDDGWIEDESCGEFI